MGAQLSHQIAQLSHKLYKAPTNRVGSSSLPVHSSLSIAHLLVLEAVHISPPSSSLIDQTFLLLIHQHTLVYSQSFNHTNTAILHTVVAFSIQYTTNRAKHPQSQDLVVSPQGVFSQDHRLLLLSQTQ